MNNLPLIQSLIGILNKFDSYLDFGSPIAVLIVCALDILFLVNYKILY